MEHQGTRVETVVTDEEGNETIEVTWELPAGVSGPYYDESITDADRLEDAWDEVRMFRSSLLKRVDIHQGVLRYDTLTESQKAELATYRQALLDITEEDSPDDAWANIPVKPEWV